MCNYTSVIHFLLATNHFSILFMTWYWTIFRYNMTTLRKAIFRLKSCLMVRSIEFGSNPLGRVAGAIWWSHLKTEPGRILCWGKKNWQNWCSASVDISDSIILNYFRDFKKCQFSSIITNSVNSFFFQLNPSNFGGVLIVAQIFLCSASLVLLKIQGIHISNILFVLGFHYLHERAGISLRGTSRYLLLAWQLQ